jgi:hypothetical protein
MDKNKRWSNIQSIIIIAIIAVMMAYMCIDFFVTTPNVKKRVDAVTVQYHQLHKYLDAKIPEIDSTIKVQSKQLNTQSNEIQGLKTTISSISKSK